MGRAESWLAVPEMRGARKTFRSRLAKQPYSETAGKTQNRIVEQSVFPDTDGEELFKLMG